MPNHENSAKGQPTFMKHSETVLISEMNRLDTVISNFAAGTLVGSIGNKAELFSKTSSVTGSTGHTEGVGTNFRPASKTSNVESKAGAATGSHVGSLVMANGYKTVHKPKTISGVKKDGIGSKAKEVENSAESATKSETNTVKTPNLFSKYT
jgi:hypothetical protein